MNVRLPADAWNVRGSVIGVCSTVGLLAGGYLPAIWGASGLSLQSLLSSALGGVAGVFVGSRLSDV